MYIPELIQRLRETNYPYHRDSLNRESADALEQQAAEIDRCKSGIAMLMADALDVEALRVDAEQLRAALNLSLEALTESVDSVRHEVNERHEWYVGMPTRAAQLAGLDQWLADHESAITAARAALRQEQPAKGEDA